METRVWYNVNEKGGCLVTVIGDVFALLTFHGTRGIRKMEEAVKKIENGSNPNVVGANRVYMYPLGKMLKVEVPLKDDYIEFHFESAGKTKKLFFQPPKNVDRNKIAQEITESTGKQFTRRQGEISLMAALTTPIIWGVIVGFLWMAVYFAATGERITGSGRYRGLKRLLAQFGSSLGPGGAIGLGFILLTIFVIWGITRANNRPKKNVWER